MQSAPATGAWAIIPAPPPAIGLHSYFVTGEQEEEQNPPGAFISERETIGQEQERVCETAASKLNHAQESQQMILTFVHHGRRILQIGK
jgi:hypothetical protein